MYENKDIYIYIYIYNVAPKFNACGQKIGGGGAFKDIVDRIWLNLT